MANLNLQDSSNIKVVQSGSDISLDFASGSQVELNTNKIGDLTTLTTTDNTTLVNAINEVDADVQLVDFTSSVSFNESSRGTCKFYKVGKIVYVQYQGQATTHNVNATLATIPASYRPSYQVVAPFTKNANAYGFISIASSNGVMSVGAISSTTASGRIYANFFYSLD